MKQPKKINDYRENPRNLKLKRNAQKRNKGTKPRIKKRCTGMMPKILMLRMGWSWVNMEKSNLARTFQCWDKNNKEKI